ncbi:hypothetical protein QT19_00045, partial [Staphylococcus aureus]
GFSGWAILRFPLPDVFKPAGFKLREVVPDGCTVKHGRRVHALSLERAVFRPTLDGDVCPPRCFLREGVERAPLPLSTVFYRW